MKVIVRIPCGVCYKLVETYYDLHMFWTAGWHSGPIRPACPECKTSVLKK